MKDDTISRKWLVECVKEGWIKFDTEKDENRFVHLVRDIAPSAQRWTPVSEGMPEVGKNVLLSVGKGLYTAEGNLKDDGTWVQYRWGANIKSVDAWAEMPEPWKGE